MFVGHYGVSLALKKAKPEMPLVVLFIMVQLLDILFAFFVLLGVEDLRIEPGFTAVNPFDLYYMPLSHGLLAATVWSSLAGMLFMLFWSGHDWRGKIRAGTIAAIAVFSHWMLDFPMHTHDLPLLGDSSPKVGLGLWNYRWASIIIEVVVLLGGWLYWQGSSLRRRLFSRQVALVAFLLAVAMATPYLPEPADATSFAFLAMAAFGVFALAARWSES